MCIPGLHLSLGIFNRLWSLLGDACSELDLKLAESSRGSDGGSTYNHYVALLKRRSALRTELNDKQSHVTLMREMVAFASLTLPDAEHSNMLKELQRDADAAQTALNNMV